MPNRFLDQVKYTPSGASGQPESDAAPAGDRVGADGSGAGSRSAGGGGAGRRRPSGTPNQSPPRSDAAAAPGASGAPPSVWYDVRKAAAVTFTKSVIVAVLTASVLMAANRFDARAIPTALSGRPFATSWPSTGTGEVEPTVDSRVPPAAIRGPGSILMEHVPTDTLAAQARIAYGAHRLAAGIMDGTKAHVWGRRPAVEDSGMLVPMVRPYSENEYMDLATSGKLGDVELQVVYPPPQWTRTEMQTHLRSWSEGCHVHSVELIKRWSEFRPARHQRPRTQCHANGRCLILTVGSCDGGTFDDVQDVH